MALGLGQILGGAILGGGLLGGKDDEEQQGIMSGISNVSNSLFAGMSQEQVYRLGQGFNSMRLEPDQGMHTSFENRITALREGDAQTKNRNATVTERPQIFLANTLGGTFSSGSTSTQLHAGEISFKLPTNESPSAAEEVGSIQFKRTENTTNKQSFYSFAIKTIAPLSASNGAVSGSDRTQEIAILGDFHLERQTLEEPAVGGIPPLHLNLPARIDNNNRRQENPNRRTEFSAILGC